MSKYLDTTKNILISSPAGSGKTEKLAMRYISLLRSGNDIKRILAITFTEKAAAEMKERILTILKKEEPSLFIKVIEQLPLMRISTIHSFCLKLLKRFTFELNLDPSTDVMDEFTAYLLWNESVYECLMEEKDKPNLFFDVITEYGLKGWDAIFKILEEVYKKRPLFDLFIDNGYYTIDQKTNNIIELSKICLERYNKKKKERGLLDFSDIELLAYKALSKNPEWQNILYSFDEHTDHILIDEIQDTSSIQWKIIYKLTEEWRSGFGAKSELGKKPTIFLVGDEKQSIYLFRGANVSLFKTAKDKLSEWFGEQFHFEEVKENYRSLPEIIQFTNELFSRIMYQYPLETWQTKYTPFEPIRKGEGHVELILLEGNDKTKENREKEATIIAKRILTLIGKAIIFDGEDRRPCSFKDIAILINRRTHLSILEDVFRRFNIPFVIIKGIGFYNEPEVAILRDIILFITNPLDDYSLFCLLRSPLFKVDYKVILNIIVKDKHLIEILRDSSNKHLQNIYDIITSFIEETKFMPLSIKLEKFLTITEGWRYFHERQRLANIKKFITIIEGYESKGLSNIEIREKLLMTKSADESKANINLEGTNAIRILTVHSAKGLQFPIVFLPSIDEESNIKSSPILIDEENDNIIFIYENDSSNRKNIKQFLTRREKEKEEEKRLFYVAVTRAQDYLFMTAIPKNKKYKGRLKYIFDNIDNLSTLKIIGEKEVNEQFNKIDSKNIYYDETSDNVILSHYFVEPIKYEPSLIWKDVTEDLDVWSKHGEDWVNLGIIFHTLFEELSKGIIKKTDIERRSYILLRNSFPPYKDLENYSKIIIDDINKLESSGILENIIFPQPNSFAELPFVLQQGKFVYNGRIDRIIIKNEIAHVYDYKTFPVKESELGELINKYRFQIDIYKKAANKILSKKVKGFIIFTHIQQIIEI